jgi:hypothetical protein
MTGYQNEFAIIIRKNLHYNSRPYLNLHTEKQRELWDFGRR